MPSAVRPRNVLQLIETGGPGGAERVLINLCESLKSRGWGVTAGLLKTGWLKDQLDRRSVPVRLLQLSRPLDPVLLWRLCRLIKELRIELVHAHEFTMNWYGSLAGRLAGVPVVATVHGKHYYGEALRRRVMLRSVQWAGGEVVAVSDDIKSFLESKLGLRRVRCLPNGIDVHRFSKAIREEARRELGFSPQDFVIGAIGNLYTVKGHAVLVEAAASLKDPRLHVVIGGRGDQEQPLRELAARLGLGDRLRLLGFREDVPRLLAAFDAYALPSFSEGQSLSLMEAMAAELPIVASRVGGNPELLEEGRCGLLFEAGRADQLADSIRILRTEPDRMLRLAADARARACRDYSLENMIERYLALYDGLSARSPGSGRSG
jgi:glycosyltransferase involved in cell wall biosynthesis